MNQTGEIRNPKAAEGAGRIFPEQRLYRSRKPLYGML